MIHCTVTIDPTKRSLDINAGGLDNVAAASMFTQAAMWCLAQEQRQRSMIIDPSRKGETDGKDTKATTATA